MLQDLLVIELASVLAGPAVGQFFAELGARVIKIENAITGGDVTRNWKVSGENLDKDDSAYFRSVNFGKQSQMLDFNKTADREVAYELIKQADIVITNFPEATARKLGMELRQLQSLNSRLIIAQLDAFPISMGKRPAYDIVLQAETGFLSMTGTKAGEICRMPVALIDLLAAHQLKEGILLALLKRASTGAGSLVRANLYDAALASLANQATNYLIAGKIPGPMGSEHPNIAPYGDIFITSDGHRVVLAVGSDRQFEKLCAVLKIHEIPETFRTNSARVAQREALVCLLANPIRQLSLAETLLLCESENIPVGHVKNMEEVFATAAAQDRLLRYADGQRIVKTVAFDVTDHFYKDQ